MSEKIKTTFRTRTTTTPTTKTWSFGQILEKKEEDIFNTLKGTFLTQSSCHFVRLIILIKFLSRLNMGLVGLKTMLLGLNLERNGERSSSHICSRIIVKINQNNCLIKSHS